MLNSLANFFQYQFVVNAFVAALLIAVAAGMVGSYIVAKRLVFLSGGITHASFGGIGIAYFLGVNPLAGAAAFAVLSAFGVEALSQRMAVREDSAIGILWSVGMAIGIFFIYLTPGYSPNLMTFLFGSILTVSSTDIWLLLTLNMVMVAFFLLFYRSILYLAFDPDFAKTQRIPVKTFSYILKGFLALTIVLSIRMVGIILLISLLTIPPSTANLFTKRFNQIIFASIAIGFLGAVGGLLISYNMNVPSGATIIMVLVAIFAVAKLLRFLFVKIKLRRA
ncbi:MAG: metal ABC transporter permease [Tenuifilaceae bacterium]|jgi:zinc transport system permease protein|uniref:metal ABC transporter permease n=1 Tax=Perlabentimonas gracilis TaxID=2715279 RepID=UPI00140D096D|nr:metal ABC transporter permease [Perlabentimonas gracilis]MDX9771209.1 metal ABC transporter permease [Tenuifilaceae bacterium]NHB70062.1 metal ABC transporter permease [Perlabentimonas gracilis]